MFLSEAHVSTKIFEMIVSCARGIWMCGIDAQQLLKITASHLLPRISLSSQSMTHLFFQPWRNSPCLDRISLSACLEITLYLLMFLGFFSTPSTEIHQQKRTQWFCSATLSSSTTVWNNHMQLEAFSWSPNTIVKLCVVCGHLLRTRNNDNKWLYDILYYQL